MNLLNIFEDSNTPGLNYAEELAYQIFKVAPDLDATGAADEVLDYAFDLAVNDLGRKRAHSLFAYDEDFDSDLVTAYVDLQMNKSAEEKKQADHDRLATGTNEGVTEGEVYDLEKEYGYEKPATQPKRASVPPTRPSLHPEDTDFMDPVERRLRADQARVKAAWAAHNAKKDTNESHMSEIDAEYQDYKKLSPREFYNMYRITKQAWLAKYKSMLPQSGNVVQGSDLKTVSRANLGQNKLNLPTGYGDVVQPQKLNDVEEASVGNRMSDMSVGSPKIVYKNGKAVGEIGVDHEASPGNGPYYMKHYETNTSYSGYDSKKAALADLKHVVDQMNEGIGGDMAKLIGIPVVAGAAAIGAQHYDDQQPHVEIGGQNAKIVRADSSRIPSNAMTLTGKDGKTYRVWQQSGKGMNKMTLAAPVEQVKEADKKKDDEPEVRDVALQRAISRAKADFPTAGTGIEALAKDFMRSQDQDQKSFDQIRQAERQQDQMLAQISQIDQEQEQEIQSLEQQNSTLASRLQQLQSVNSELEKKLAAMSGRKAEKKSKTDSAPAVSATAPAVDVKVPAVKSKAKTKTKIKTKAQPSTSSMKSTAAQLAAPNVDPMAAMTQRIQQGDASILNPKQQALQFEPSDNVLEPVIPQQQVNPRFAAAKRDAADVDPRYYADIAKKVAGSPEQFKAAMSNVREDEKEVDYDDPRWDAMVKRVGQKAREQEKIKPVDIADLARRLAAIDASKKDK